MFIPSCFIARSLLYCKLICVHEIIHSLSSLPLSLSHTHTHTHTKLPSTRTLYLTILNDLTLCMQAGLKYEGLYWLVYNAVTLSYTIIRQLMAIDLPGKVQ